MILKPLHEKGSVRFHFNSDEYLYSAIIPAANQFLPKHILTSLLKAIHALPTFSEMISRKLQGWMRTDLWDIKSQTGIEINYVLWQAFIKFIEAFWKNCYLFNSLIQKFFLSCLDWKLVTEVNQLKDWGCIWGKRELLKSRPYDFLQVAGKKPHPVQCIMCLQSRFSQTDLPHSW